MDNFMIPFHYNNIDLDTPSLEDITFYINRAYRQCYFDDSSPDLYELTDNLIEEVLLSERNAFSFNGMVIGKSELFEPYFVEFMLKDFLFQHVGSNGEEVCDCQNILIQEMIENE